MKLHNNKTLFKALILQVEQSGKLTADILEKDYYVTLILRELTERQSAVKAYFKGGTALYKAIGKMRRFSEDIDLTVDVAKLSINQSHKRLEAAVYDYSLTLNKQDEQYSKHKGSITAVYDYESVFFTHAKEDLQRFGKVLIEATSFTVSEPVTKYTIAPLIYDLTTEQNKEILRGQFDVSPFEIKTIELERIFVDKIFAAEFYFQRKSWYDAAKHIYDLAVLSDIYNIKTLLINKEKLNYLISLKRREEQICKGGISAELRIKDFAYFDGLENNADFYAAYKNMQGKYVLDTADVIGITETVSAIKQLRDKLKIVD